MSFISAPLQTILLKPQRKIGNIVVTVVVNENTTDNLTVTKQPVQQGALITDHAFLEPTVFSTTIYFQDNILTSTQDALQLSNPFAQFSSASKNPLAAMYQKLLDLQSSRIPFSIVTPKRLYKNMLMTTLSQVTDKTTENCLAINASFTQVIIVSVSTVTIPASHQANPQTTAATEKAGVKNTLLKTISNLPSVLTKILP